MKIRVIIPYYEGETYISRCLQSVTQSDCTIAEIIVVDNSPKRLHSTLFQSISANVACIRAKIRIGFARACNLGIDYALKQNTDVIVILNQDTWLKNDCIRKIAFAVQNDSKVFAAAPLSLTYDGLDISKFFYKTYLADMQQMHIDFLRGQVKDSYPVPFSGVNAACLAISAQHLRATGAFDPLFFMYEEERDLLQRASRQGKNFLFVPSASACHFHTNAHEGEKSIIKQWQRRSQAIRYLKNHARHPSIAFLLWIKYSAKKLFSLIIRLRIGQAYQYLKIDLAVAADLPKIFRHRSQQNLFQTIVIARNQDQESLELYPADRT